MLDVAAEVVGPEGRRHITTLSACSAAEGELGLLLSSPCVEQADIFRAIPPTHTFAF